MVFMIRGPSIRIVRLLETIAWSMVLLCAALTMVLAVHRQYAETTMGLMAATIGGAVLLGFSVSRLLSLRRGWAGVGLDEYRRLVEENVRRRTTELSLVNEDLQDELARYPTVRKQLEQRLAHLAFLYRLSKSVEPDHLNLPTVFAQTAEMLREVYRNPDRTCVRITFDGIPYESSGFTRTETGQYAAIATAQGKSGAIEVFLRTNDTDTVAVKDAFSTEERELLDTVAERLGRIAELSEVSRRLTSFRGLIDGSYDHAFVIDPTWGRLMDVNRTACERLGYSREELLERTIGQIDGALLGDVAWSRWRDELRRTGNRVAEGVHTCKSGLTFSVETSFRWVSEGSQDYIIAMSRDITERKHAERKQAELIEQLRRTNEKVESINRELKDFAHVVSHDLKAPLVGIKSMADWLGKDYADRLDAEGADQLRQLSEMARRMERLIAGILEYSRAGHVKEPGVEVDLNEAAADAIDMVAAPSHIDIAVEGRLPVVECVETRMHQVFQNLISNAVKYMDKPHGVIRIRCGQDGDFWRFCVEDNGPGIAVKDRERIFRIFQTVAPKDSLESTGIGLAVVKRIVELYGGRIWVESEVGAGSRFYFTLPRTSRPALETHMAVGAACE